MSFVLAHLSDPHLSPLERPAWRDLASKRALGYLNWRRGREDIHRAEVLDDLVADLRTRAPDEIVVTGDLTNIALPVEFAAAASWLERLGTPDHVTVIPGNHDAYVSGALEEGLALWRDYVRSDDASDAPRYDAFPIIRRRGKIALIGVSSAVPSGPFMATGRVGGRQLVRLADDLVGLSREGLCRIVLIHHPLWVRRRHFAKRLLDAGATRTVLTAAGAELVLHGHMHHASTMTLPGPRSEIPVVGVPSASADPTLAREPAGYALYRIEDLGDSGWRIELERRGFVDGAIATTEQRVFTLAPARA